MSKKSTKVIAALGVVAGIGMAALPLSSYAESTPNEITVEVGGSFVMTTDPNIATCTSDGTTHVLSEYYGPVTLEFTSGTDTPKSDDTGVCLLSNTAGTYEMKIGTGFNSTVDTTILYSDSLGDQTGGASSAANMIIKPVTDNTKDTLAVGTAEWGYKFKGANRGATATTGAVSADANFRAPQEYGDAASAAGRILGTGVTMPNSQNGEGGDYWGITVGAAVSAAHHGQYTGSLIFHATATPAP